MTTTVFIAVHQSEMNKPSLSAVYSHVYARARMHAWLSVVAGIMQWIQQSESENVVCFFLGALAQVKAILSTCFSNYR